MRITWPSWCCTWKEPTRPGKHSLGILNSNITGPTSCLETEFSQLCASSGPCSVLGSSRLPPLDYIPQSMWHLHLGALTQQSVLINPASCFRIFAPFGNTLPDGCSYVCSCSTQPNKPFSLGNPTGSSLTDRTCTSGIISTACLQQVFWYHFIHLYYFMRSNGFH